MSDERDGGNRGKGFGCSSCSRGATTRDTTRNANAVTEKSAMSTSRCDVMP